MANFDDQEDDENTTDDVAPVAQAEDNSQDQEEPESEPAESEAPAEEEGDEKGDDEIAPADMSGPQSGSLLDQPDKAAMIKAYLQANDDTGVRNAIANSQRQNNIANFGSALDTIATANSAAHGGKGSDASFWQGLQTQGQQGVKLAQDQRQAALNNLAQQNEIQKQVALQTMQKGTYEQQQKAAQFQNDLNDPDSQASQNAQTAFAATFKGQPAAENVDLSDFSANDIANMSKNVDLMAKVNEMKSTKQMQIAMQQSVLADKKQKQQDELYTNANKQLLSARGNPAVQQAQVGIVNADKALSLINEYPDANKMPTTQVQLLNDEIEKIATGGAGTEGGRAGLAANTLVSNWNAAKSRFTGLPTGAGVGAFIANNKKYLQDLKQINQQTVADTEQRVYNGVKSRFSPDQDAQWKSDNPAAFNTQIASSTKSNGVPLGVLAANHPDAAIYKDWALKNPNDPRSAQILQRLGMQNAANINTNP